MVGGGRSAPPALPPAGLAPGYAIAAGPTRLYVLPGVPGEIEAMWPPILAELARDGLLSDVAVRTVRAYGVGEIQAQPLLDEAAADGLDVAVTASAGEVTVVVKYEPGDERAAARVERLVADLEATLPVFSSDGRSIDDIVADRLRERGETVAVAESCTGGGLGGRLTALPRSSDYFLGGVIAYANEAKMELLEVPHGMLGQYGAVSGEVAGAMAEGVRATLRATYGVAITGVAGPGGGTAEKPAGLVYLGCSSPQGTVVEERRFAGGRHQVRRWAIVAALHLLHDAIVS
jgi:nicotinamide-nucleotide amidase